MEKLQVILNPASSSGRSLQTWEKIRPLFERAGIVYEIHMSAGERGVEAVCEDLTSGQAEDAALCIIGGDGTVNAAVNGIKDFSRVKVSIIQAGSGNDFARGVGLPEDMEEIVRRIAAGKVRRYCDVGEVKAKGFPGRKFVVSAGIGFDAAICHGVETSGLKQFLNRFRLGKLSYIGIACREIFACPVVKMKIQMTTGTETETIRCRKALFAAVMNTQYEGGGFRFAPDAAYDDGILNLCAADSVPRLSFFRIFPHAYDGSHLQFPGVFSGKGEIMDIYTDRPLWVHTDGEILGRSNRIRVCVNRKALRLMC